MPSPALGDVFVWLFGLAAIAFCAASIALSRKPIFIAATEIVSAENLGTDIRISNEERVVSLILIAFAIMGVWVFVLRDRWRSYEQSLNLLGVVARRGTTLTEHTGKVRRPFSTARKTNGRVAPPSDQYDFRRLNFTFRERLVKNGCFLPALRK